MDNRFIHTIHLPGTLSADAHGVVPMASHVGATLLEVAVCASNASAGALALGLGGANPDADAIMTAKAIGQSGAPTIFTVAAFDGVLADPLRTSCPRSAPRTCSPGRSTTTAPAPTKSSTSRSPTIRAGPSRDLERPDDGGYRLQCHRRHHRGSPQGPQQHRRQRCDRDRPRRRPVG